MQRYDCITLAASPSLFFLCSIQMSDSAKKKPVEQKKNDDKERKRSDVGHIYRRRSNSDRSCQTERRKRLGSIVRVLCVVILTLDKDNEKKEKKKE
jgi:hypothetical protein